MPSLCLPMKQSSVSAGVATRLAGTGVARTDSCLGDRQDDHAGCWGPLQPRSSSTGAVSAIASRHRARRLQLGDKRGPGDKRGSGEGRDDAVTTGGQADGKASRSLLVLRLFAYVKRKATTLGERGGNVTSSSCGERDDEWSWTSNPKRTEVTPQRISNVYGTLRTSAPPPPPLRIRPPPPLPLPVQAQLPPRRQTITGSAPPTNCQLAKAPPTAEVKLVRILKLDKILTNKWISGIAVTKKNEYLIVDLKGAHLIDEFGNLKRTIGAKGQKRLQEPIDATVMACGNLAVSDHASRDVKVFNAKGQLLDVVRDESLCNIAGVAACARGRILVAGTDKQRISVFHHSGSGASNGNSAASGGGGGGGAGGDSWKLLYAIPPPADEQSSSQRRPMFEHPYSVAVNPLTGHVIVGDDYRQLVTAVCPNTSRVAWRFTPPGDRNRHFFPSSICVDNDGYVFVADLYNEKVYMLDSSGKYLKAILSRGDGLGGGPGAIAVDGRGHLIVADEERTLKVFKYGENGFALYRRFSYCPNVA